MARFTTMKHLLNTTAISVLLLTTTQTNAIAATGSVAHNTGITAINTGRTAVNTESATHYLDKILNVLTNALFGRVAGMGEYMAAFVAITPAQAAGYNIGNDMLQTISESYMGNAQGTTLTNNYDQFFDGFLLDPEVTTFPTQYTNSGNLFINPASGFNYTGDQEQSVLRYIANLGGATTSILRDPSTEWQPTAPDDFTTADNMMKYNARYAALSSIYSMSNNNLTYIAGQRMGINMAGEFEDYGSSSISSIGIIRYIQNHMVGREAWWENLSVTPLSSAIKENVTLTAGVFVMLVKIHELLERSLAAQSALITLRLMDSELQTKTLMDNITNNS